MLFVQEGGGACVLQFTPFSHPRSKISGSATVIATILCHMTSNLLVQTKDDEMYKCISIANVRDISLSNNFNLVNSDFHKLADAQSGHY